MRVLSSNEEAFTQELGTVVIAARVWDRVSGVAPNVFFAAGCLVGYIQDAAASTVQRVYQTRVIVTVYT